MVFEHDARRSNGFYPAFLLASFEYLSRVQLENKQELLGNYPKNQAVGGWTKAAVHSEGSGALVDLLICKERKALKVAHNDKYKSKVMRVCFEDGLFTNTFEIVARFAKHADLAWNDAKQAHARSVIANRLSWKKHRGRYRVSDFGLEDDGIAGRLATICDDIPETVEGLNEYYNLKL